MLRASKQGEYILRRDALQNKGRSRQEVQPIWNSSRLKLDTKQSLDSSFQELFDPNSPDGQRLWNFVIRALNSFRLDRTENPAGIVNEVYLRAVKFIDQGGKIDPVIAWCRATAYNYIRELSRLQQRQEFYEDMDTIVDNNQGSLEVSPLINDEILGDELAVIRQAFDQLSSDDRELISLSVVHNLSWREIHKHLNAQGHRPRSEAALRKAKERAVRRLRENYHGMKPLTPKVSDLT